MKRVITPVLAVLLAIILLCCAVPFAANAASNAITYTWQGTHAYDAGFAQGTITVSADASSGGTYYLYWADDSAALSGYYPICTLTVANNGSASFTMPENTAIPAKATRVLAFKSSGEPSNRSVSAATMSYKLPIDKAPYKTDSDLLYSFASYSDIHITSGETGAQGQKYPYDEEHLADAFRTAAARDVDFIVTTGDNVTNHRNDSKGRGNPHYPEEWATYLRILAASDFDKPIYEAIGNHELWNYEDEAVSKIADDSRPGSDYFRAMSGLDSTAATMETGKAYYEITEPTTGDHFLFMALEGGFYSDADDQFSIAQLDWLESKLRAYQNDGKNTFILEHANFDNWGAGDKTPPLYDIPLKESGYHNTTATTRLKNLLKTNKNAVLLCGHTHFQFDLGKTYSNINYSTNNKTSATIIHNSSVGAIRDIRGGQRYNDTSRAGTEGYIVEVYANATIFHGTNLYENRIIPSATYLVPQRTSPLVAPTEPPQPTQAPTQAPAVLLYGDADSDGDVTSIDVTYIQRDDVMIELPTPLNRRNADVDGDDDINVIDATLIQRYISGAIRRFPVEETASTGAAFDVAEFGVDCDIAVVGAQVELEPAGDNLSTLRTQAKKALDQYWLLASYDQYQALKNAYRRNADYSALSAAYSAFNTAVARFYPVDKIDIYFSNNVGWSNVYAYCSAGHDKDKNASWPGEKMTKYGKNSYNEDVYKYTVSTSRFNYVIFSNGAGTQTIDLPLGAVRDQGYYYDADLGTDGGKLKCSFYVCDPSSLKLY
ncbi:starch-binding protein [Ruminococcus sp.]|uniref:starch-binding protein n=1 Tax=Ruminococcus sp. TaxID=41978 RepID=UPI00388D3DE8